MPESQFGIRKRETMELVDKLCPKIGLQIIFTDIYSNWNL